MGRRYGWAADHVRAIELVTADGVARRATADTEPELFWALRGGREPLAVVTAVEVALFAVPQIVGGGLFFAATDAPQVLPAVRAIGAEAPDELGVSLGAIDIPDLPAVPAPLRGRQVLHVRLVDATPEGEAATDAADRLGAAGEVLLGGIRAMPYPESGSIFAEPEAPHAYRGTNVLVAEPRRRDAGGRSSRPRARPPCRASSTSAASAGRSAAPPRCPTRCRSATPRGSCGCCRPPTGTRAEPPSTRSTTPCCGRSTRCGAVAAQASSTGPCPPPPMSCTNPRRWPRCGACATASIPTAGSVR